MGRFDYIRYDAVAMRDQIEFKKKFENIEDRVEMSIKNKRWKEAALMKLEEAYMCIGKGIRDDQIERNEGAEPQEERNDE